MRTFFKNDLFNTICKQLNVDIYICMLDSYKQLLQTSSSLTFTEKGEVMERKRLKLSFKSY